MRNKDRSNNPTVILSTKLWSASVWLLGPLDLLPLPLPLAMVDQKLTVRGKFLEQTQQMMADRMSNASSSRIASFSHNKQYAGSFWAYLDSD